MSQAPDISLPCFEGPLDLLLSLVRKNELEITDLPIADITRQYLEYLHEASELDLDLGSEFVHMAAVLIQIKARCLLSQDPEITCREEDPRQELVRQLLDHEQVRQGAEFLSQKLKINEATWSRCPVEELEPFEREEMPAAGGAFNLLQVLRLAQQALATARTHDLLTPADSVTVQEMMGWLSARIAATPDGLNGQALLAEQPDASHQVALFLAILEMTNSARIHLEQPEPFGPIAIITSRPSVIVAHACHNVESAERKQIEGEDPYYQLLTG